ncbi:Glutamate/phenylalanine/leucine/valine dehydrogenase [Trametopsis cervina]|nr:Glutamate/phenylalanine/leucine/valine dehydrogenase [Trametopsis cervina]
MSSLTATGAAGYSKDVEAIATLKLQGGSLDSLVGQGSFTQDKFAYHAGQRPWGLLEKIHIALPCATQNEISGEEAEVLIKAGVKIVAEGSNMSSTQEAVDIFEKSRKEGGIWYAPGKASNVGGVAVSGLEMAQNSQRLQWSSEDVDAKLKDIMTKCYEICLEAGSKWSDDEEGLAEKCVAPSLLAGANVAGFIKYYTTHAGCVPK